MQDAWELHKEALRHDFEGEYTSLVQEAYEGIDRFRSNYEASVTDFRALVDE